MNVSTTSFSPTQVILAWTLLIVLLSWFILFTTLAIHDYVMKKVEWEDIPTPSKPIQVIGVPYKTEHYNFVEMAGSPKHQEHAKTE